MQSPEQDQRNSGMEDSTKTIEFLRARLLSERSVSRTAKQRADELAERVSELEEQLRIVSLQRKKAEKATADVLSILETRGISDASEPFYSSSDNEEGPTKGRGGSSRKELDSLSLSGRSLSWKGGRKDSPRPLEKHKDSSMRRQSSFASGNSSGKHCQGKSCRQIKRREHRSETSDFVEDSTEVDSQNHEATASSGSHQQHLSETGADISNGETRSMKETISVGVDEVNAVNEFLEVGGYGVERDMETALEHQAQLIDQYEAMEKVQREWEQKYRENNSSTAYFQDSYDPGNHSDITEEREEIKAPHTTYTRETASIQTPEANSELKATSNGINQASLAHKTPSPRANGSSNQDIKQNHHLQPSNQSRPEPYALVARETSNSALPVVLDNLKRAKQLLHKHMVVGRQPPQTLSGPTTVPLCTEKADILGLFRLPTDFSPNPSRGNNFLLPSSSLCLPESSALITAQSRGRSLSSRFAENSRPSLYGDDGFQRLSPYTEHILPMANPIPYHRFSPDLAPRGPSKERFSLDLASDMPPSDRFLFQNNRGMNMMHR